MDAVRRLVLFLLIPCGALSAAGCDKKYTLAPVSGRILLDKRPLANAEVSFYPTSGNDLPYATGVTDDEGNYRLEATVTGGTADGAVVGPNRVTVTMSRAKMTKQMVMKDHQAGGRDPVVPARYNRDSQLTFTVPPEGSKDANFELSSK